MIFFTSDHFWSSITRRATCSFQELSILVRITETKIDYFDTFIKIDNGEFVQIVQMPDLESLLDGQIEWLDSVDHFTEY